MMVLENGISMEKSIESTDQHTSNLMLFLVGTQTGCCIDLRIYLRLFIMTDHYSGIPVDDCIEQKKIKEKPYQPLCMLTELKNGIIEGFYTEKIGMNMVIFFQQ